MATIRYGSHRCDLADGESVLDGLLRQGAPVAYACKAGSCGSCLLRMVEGSVPARAQAGLKDSWKARGYFLACVCIPENEIELSRPGDDLRFSATIKSLSLL